MNSRNCTIVLTALVTGLSTGMLTGCAGSFAPNPLPTDQVAIGKIQGVNHGGQSPLSGSHVYLYAAGTTGYNTSAVSLLTAAANTTADTNGNYYVTSDSNGGFSITGDYTCTAGTQVYLVGVGGIPGTGTGNTAIVQMAALGQCPASGSLAAQVPFVTMNEISTVAMAYALGGFGTTAYNISSSGTALAQAAIANAFANVSNIYDLASGQARPIALNNPNSVAPQQKLYALANVLASCVNTAKATSTACTNLFSDATSDGTSTGTLATNETEAIFNIVHNPTAFVSKLYSRQGSTPPFAPSLSGAPDDWTLPVVYSGLVSHADNIALDATGNVWISDQNNGVIYMTPQGAATTFSYPDGSIQQVAIDPSGKAWAVDGVNNDLYVLTPSGQTNTITGGGLNAPSAIAFDHSGNAYVANTTTPGISEFNSAGTPLTANAYTFASVTDPLWIAVDTSGTAWLPSSSTSTLGELVSGATKGTVNRGIVSSPSIAIDANNNVWVLGNSAKIEEISGGTLLGSYTGGGLSGPNTIAIDGVGNLWVANLGAATISSFSASGTAITGGFDTGAAGNCYAAAVDGSGNVWTANTDGTVTQLLGLAAPTAMPLLPGQFGTKP